MPENVRRRSTCILDCPDACSLEVEVRDGRLVSVDGTRHNPLTDGYVCGKVRSGLVEHHYGPHRLLHPEVRVGAKGSGDTRQVGWDEALDRIAAALLGARDEHGGESILPFSYGGSNGYLSQDTTDARLFHRLGASGLARVVCAAPSAAAHRGLYGRMPGVALPDYVHARGIVVWGANPAVSGIHLMPHLQEARRRGAWLAVVDPRRTAVARIADLHLPVRPGTDLPVALSILRWLFEEDRADGDFLAEHCSGADELRRRAAPWTFQRAAAVAGVPAAMLHELAHRYADAEPAVIRSGWGMERNRNGGSAVAAVLALPAVAGKFGVRGGGFTASNSPAWTLESLDAAGEEFPGTRVVNMNRLGAVLTGDADPPVKVLFVYNCNPLATMPAQGLVRRGLAREDLFTVVFDQVRTDTARYADVVLPATTFLERDELSRGYGAYVLQRSAAAVPPAGESRSNHEVFAELCARTGVARPGEPVGADELARAIVGSNGGGAVLAGLADGPVTPAWGDRPVQLVDVRPRTSDGRIHLVPDDLDREAARRGGLYAFEEDPGDGRHPLALISPATKRTISSTLGQLRREQVPLELHPDDARARRIEDGDVVRVHNELGEVRCRARVNAELRPGVACLPKGMWSHNTLDGRTGNALVPDTLADLGGGACFNDARVEVERADEPASGPG